MFILAGTCFRYELYQVWLVVFQIILDGFFEENGFGAQHFEAASGLYETILGEERVKLIIGSEFALFQDEFADLH